MLSHKYVKRTGISGAYRYWYRDENDNMHDPDAAQEMGRQDHIQRRLIHASSHGRSNITAGDYNRIGVAVGKHYEHIQGIARDMRRNGRNAIRRMGGSPTRTNSMAGGTHGYAFEHIQESQARNTDDRGYLDHINYYFSGPDVDNAHTIHSATGQSYQTGRRAYRRRPTGDVTIYDIMEHVGEGDTFHAKRPHDETWQKYKVLERLGPRSLKVQIVKRGRRQGLIGQIETETGSSQFDDWNFSFSRPSATSPTTAPSELEVPTGTSPVGQSHAKDARNLNVGDIMVIGGTQRWEVLSRHDDHYIVKNLANDNTTRTAFGSVESALESGYTTIIPVSTTTLEETPTPPAVTPEPQEPQISAHPDPTHWSNGPKADRVRQLLHALKEEHGIDLHEKDAEKAMKFLIDSDRIEKGFVIDSDRDVLPKVLNSLYVPRTPRNFYI